MGLENIELVKDFKLKSKWLSREVNIDLILPKNLGKNSSLKVLLLNDGQDFYQLQIDKLLNRFYSLSHFPLLYVGIHCNEDRLYEYGTIGKADYKNRGNKANEHAKFVLKELLPFLKENYPVSNQREDWFYGGFSLGGLSAFDFVWEHSDLFSKAGVFSGSFWWRSKPYEDGYEEDAHRIMHQKIKEGKKKNSLSFWLQCGTRDEPYDRNNNGIIDSIDDTLDLIHCLRKKGISNITYREIAGGEHNFHTWKKVFPEFLHWLQLSSLSYE